MTRTVVVITAGLSVPSSTRLLADQVADAVTAQVGARGEAVRLEHVELRELAGDLASYMTSGGVPTARLSEVRDLVSSADGMIAVTPVFTASYSGLFKMFFDALDTDALNGMPVLIAATAGTRPALAGARPRDASALRLPAGRGRPDRRLRRHRGLRRHHRPHGADHPRRGGAGRASWWAPTTSPASDRTRADVVRRARPAPTSAR